MIGDDPRQRYQKRFSNSLAGVRVGFSAEATPSPPESDASPDPVCAPDGVLRRPIVTPQLLARLASAALADVPTLGLAVKLAFLPIEGVCSEAVRRRLSSTLDMPSDAE